MGLLPASRGRARLRGARDATSPAAPHRPRQGNRIWLVTCVITVAVLTGGAVRWSAGACAASRGPGALMAGPAALTAVRPGSSPASAASAASGHAVFYDPGRAAGSCSLGPFPATGWYASLPPRAYGDGAVCGSYVEVRGSSGSVRAEVVDLCAKCRAGTIDLSRAAFEHIAAPRAGTVPVKYWPVTDPPLRGPLVLRVLRVTTAAGRGSLAIQVTNHGNRLASVEAAAPGRTQWQRLAANPDGYWTARLRAARAGGLDIRIRITDTMGHQVVISGVKLRTGAVRSTVWMYGHRGQASPAAGARDAAADAAPSRGRAGGGC
jgi:expansin (peptidoglycan-binding protein)